MDFTGAGPPSLAWEGARIPLFAVVFSSGLENENVVDIESQGGSDHVSTPRN